METWSMYSKFEIIWKNWSIYAKFGIIWKNKAYLYKKFKIQNNMEKWSIYFSTIYFRSTVDWHHCQKFGIQKLVFWQFLPFLFREVFIQKLWDYLVIFAITGKGGGGLHSPKTLVFLKHPKIPGGPLDFWLFICLIIPYEWKLLHFIFCKVSKKNPKKFLAFQNIPTFWLAESAPHLLSASYKT